MRAVIVVRFKTFVTEVYSAKINFHFSNFLKTLSAFPKILVAGVQGESIGLGVTMLPLFDVVIASDDAKFNVPNAKLGCIAEGGSVLSLPHVTGNVLVSWYFTRANVPSKVTSRFVFR